MDRQVVKERLQVGLAALFDNDAFLLTIDVAERTIAACLKGHLKDLFPSHDVDTDYNRHGISPKRLNLPEGCDKTGEKLVYPDLLVHNRGNDDDNVLVIEVKKSSNKEPRDCDRAKVRGMIEQLGYEHGLLLELPIEENPSIEHAREEWLHRD